MMYVVYDYVGCKAWEVSYEEWAQEFEAKSKEKAPHEPVGERRDYLVNQVDSNNKAPRPWVFSVINTPDARMDPDVRALANEAYRRRNA